MSKVVIIGAGLAGSLLAIYLAKRSIAVDIYEARGDIRLGDVNAGRSINLALSDRGIAALRGVGMENYVLAATVPMYGRMIHPVSGETRLLPYSGRQGEYINSVSRAGLNVALMDEATKYAGVRMFFNERCVDFNCVTSEAKFSSGKSVTADTLIATDGAGSAVRHAMMHGGVERFDFSQKWLEHGYKELVIPARSFPKAIASDPDTPLAANPSDNFLLEKNALHIWPRNKFMMIALPNFDGSFTCTLFLAHKSEEQGGAAFSKMTDERSVVEFFNREFPDAAELMPTLAADFFANATGNLGTIKCFPWNASGKALLLGDSAHAVVPFYGQGMNCAFEDVRVLDELIGKHGANWGPVYQEYGELRKVNTDAIADMAEENFYEMRDAVVDPVFIRKRELETKLENTYPDYFSKYSMVTFRDDLPYSVAKQRGNEQDKLLMEICSGVESVSEIDLSKVMRKVSSQNDIGVDGTSEPPY